MKTYFFAAFILLGFAVSLPFPERLAAGETTRNSVDDPVLDRNGDGTQDVIVYKRKAHYDVDFDGLFDYTLTLRFEEHTTDGHRKYIGSGCSGEVFAELMSEGLDRLCQEERENASWLEDNFSSFHFYHDGYGLLSIFTDDQLNDGRLADRKHKGAYGYIVAFNPDGSVKTVRRGSDRVKLATFDYESSSSSGEKMFLRKIESAGDLQRVKEELDGLFPEKPGT